jgi:hypothetical protein
MAELAIFPHLPQPRQPAHYYVVQLRYFLWHSCDMDDFYFFFLDSIVNVTRSPNVTELSPQILQYRTLFQLRAVLNIIVIVFSRGYFVLTLFITHECLGPVLCNKNNINYSIFLAYFPYL